MIYTEDDIKGILMSKFNYHDITIKTISDRVKSIRVNFVPKTSHLYYQSLRSVEITLVDIREWRLKNIGIK
jgi:hypothetical protein